MNNKKGRIRILNKAKRKQAVVCLFCGWGIIRSGKATKQNKKTQSNEAIIFFPLSYIYFYIPPLITRDLFDGIANVLMFFFSSSAFLWILFLPSSQVYYNFLMFVFIILLISLLCSSFNIIVECAVANAAQSINWSLKSI